MCFAWRLGKATTANDHPPLGGQCASLQFQRQKARPIDRTWHVRALRWAGRKNQSAHNIVRRRPAGSLRALLNCARDNCFAHQCATNTERAIPVIDCQRAKQQRIALAGTHMPQTHSARDQAIDQRQPAQDRRQANRPARSNSLDLAKRSGPSDCRARLRARQYPRALLANNRNARRFAQADATGDNGSRWQ